MVSADGESNGSGATSGLGARDGVSRRVAVFGGSFNPPHVGHVLAATYVLSACEVDGLLVVPVYRHPFMKELAPFEARLEMCRLAMGWLPGVSVSTIERDIGGESRTLYTLQALREREPGWQWRLVIGADVLADLPNWHRFDEVARIAPPIVLGRAGINAPEAPPAVLPEVSSTAVRSMLAGGDRRASSAVVPRRVMVYIEQHALYGLRPSPAGAS